MHRLIRWACLTAIATACGGDQPDPYDLDFEVPGTEAFAPTLSAYDVYEPADSLTPAPGVLPYDLGSELFTDYAYKQRLVKVPEGTAATRTADGGLVYPEGSILVKTFYYPQDMGNPDSDIRVIETRLLVKTQGLWNAATYLWNEEQTEATLLLTGTTTEVSWVDATGESRSTTYAVPREGECYTCHQSDDEPAYIGPTLTNLNRAVTRDSGSVEQLVFLGDAGVLEPDAADLAPSMPNYKDTSLPLDTRARAYLDINCAHCHKPDGWDELANRELDFRFSTPFAETGLQRKAKDLPRLMERGRMPYLGTTLLHTEGIELIEAWAETQP